MVDKRSGSTRTERIKLRHQDFRFYVTDRKRQNNPADYLSRNAVSWDLLTKFKKKEIDDLTHLLYTLHFFPVTHTIGIKVTAKRPNS